jgi:hypothetical protein
MLTLSKPISAGQAQGKRDVLAVWTIGGVS